MNLRIDSLDAVPSRPYDSMNLQSKFAFFTFECNHFSSHDLLYAFTSSNHNGLQNDASCEKNQYARKYRPQGCLECLRRNVAVEYAFLKILTRASETTILLGAEWFDIRDAKGEDKQRD